MAMDRIVGRTGWDRARFAVSLGLDLVGNASYLGYLLGPGAVATEGTDTIFAPVQALWILVAYQGWGRIPAAIFGGLEELAPGTDGIPTCTLYHIYAMRSKYPESGQTGVLPEPTR